MAIGRARSSDISSTASSRSSKLKLRNNELQMFHTGLVFQKNDMVKTINYVLAEIENLKSNGRMESTIQ